MDAYDLPEEFSHLQAQDMGKIGFISDIVRGIKKIIGGNISATTVTTPDPSGPVASKAPPLNPTSPEKLVDKALLLIEDGNKVKARELINKALDIQPKNAEAYLGLLLLEMNVKEISDLAKSTKSLNQSQNYQRAVRFGSDSLRKRLESYDNAVEQNVIEKKYHEAVSVIEKNSENPDSTVNVSGRISALRSTEDTLKNLGDYKDSIELLEKCKSLIKPLLEIQEAQQKKKKKIGVICAAVAVVFIATIIFVVSVIVPASKYDEALKLSEEGKYQEAISAFEELRDYKDSGTQITKNKYLIAERYLDNKDFKTAAKYYEQCGDYEDSTEKIKECQYQMAVAYIAADNQDAANDLLEKIKDYKDSASLIHYHSIIILEQKDATCTEAGYKSYTCESCGYSNTEQFSALGHDSPAPTCTEDSKCSRCGIKVESALGHTDGTVCGRCGKNTFETLYFSGTGAKMISGINLPNGNYMITCTYSNKERGNNHIDIKFFYISEYGSETYDLVLNDSDLSGSQVEFFNGSVTDGYFQISPNETDCSWTITVEAQ
jgi:tetratricopeptide (TPR) repeat protein